MSTNETSDSNDTDDAIEPFPTDGEIRDHEAAAEEMGLQNHSVFRIGDDVFEYRGIICGEAAVDRLSEPKLSYNERIPMLELWEHYQRGELEHGKWRCQFVAEDESAADTDNR
jgi:hypothetical protein